MGETGEAKRGSKQIIAALLVWAVCLVLYATLRAPLFGALGLVLAALCVIVFLEKGGKMNRLMDITEANGRVTFLALAAFVLILPFLTRDNTYLMHVAVISGLHALVALGLNFQVGSTGMVNFAPAAFYGMGAYTSALLSTKLGLSPWLGTAAGMVTAAILGLVTGYPALKTRGYYLSLVTIALQTVFTLLIINTPWVGGPNGIAGVPPYKVGALSFRSNLSLGGLQLPYQTYYFYLAFAVLALAVYVASRLYSSRIGLAWNAIEQDEIVAVCQGVDLTRLKLLAFSLGAAFAGVAGALYGHYISFVGAEDFDFSKSLILICMVILGGRDNVSGVVLGAILLTIIDEKLRDFTDYRMLMYGVILVLVLLLRPQGLLPRRVRKYSYAAAGSGAGPEQEGLAFSECGR